MLSSIFALATVAAGVSAAAVDASPAAMRAQIIKRQSLTAPGTGDAVILNFALTLEHLEATFYAQGLANFTEAQFAAAGYTNVYSQLRALASEEATHVTFLTSALAAAGATPVQACTYKFPYTTPGGFIALAQILEAVGVSAYLGAAGAINNTGYLTAAGAILTVEARHNAFLRYVSGYQPAPQPFDTPQSATAVVTLATPFFVSCPAGSAPTIKPFPALTVTTTTPAIGQMLAIAPTNASAVAATNGTVYCGFASGLGAAFSTYTNGSCMIPSANITQGEVYVVLTTGPSVSDGAVIAGPQILNLEVPSNVTPSGMTVVGGVAPGTATGSAAPGGSTGAARSGASTVTVSAGIVSVVAAGFALLF